jgi:hypothetical protein
MNGFSVVFPFVSCMQIAGWSTWTYKHVRQNICLVLCATVWQIWQGKCEGLGGIEPWWRTNLDFVDGMLNAVGYIDIILVTSIFMHPNGSGFTYFSKGQTMQIINYSKYLYGSSSAEHWCHAMAVKSLEHLEWIEQQCLTQTTTKTIVSDLLQIFQRREWKIFQRCISMSKSDFIHKLVSMVMMDKKVLTFLFNIFVFGTDFIYLLHHCSL